MSENQKVRYGDPIREARQNTIRNGRIADVINRHEGVISDDIPSRLVSPEGRTNTTEETK